MQKLLIKKTSIFCLLNSFLSLIIGIIIYAFLRKQTYFHSIFNLQVSSCANIEHWLLDFLRFYLTDALWAYSLTSALFIFNSPKISIILSISFGILWEIGQFFHFLRGTGDFIDILMYITASIIAAIIIFLRRKKENEQIH